MTEQIDPKKELINNPTARIPLCFCLDISGSMEGQPIHQLTRGVNLFFDSIEKDAEAIYATDICIVTFGGEAKCELRFSSFSSNLNRPTFCASGSTPLGEALHIALDEIAQRLSLYRSQKIDYCRPCLIVMTDGGPNGDNKILEEIIATLRKQVEDEILTVLSIGIGSGACMNTLARLSPNIKPRKMQGIDFCKFFNWLRTQIIKTTKTLPAERGEIEIDSMGDWSEL